MFSPKNVSQKSALQKLGHTLCIRAYDVLPFYRWSFMSQKTRRLATAKVIGRKISSWEGEQKDYQD